MSGAKGNEKWWMVLIVLLVKGLKLWVRSNFRHQIANKVQLYISNYTHKMVWRVLKLIPHPIFGNEWTHSIKRQFAKIELKLSNEYSLVIKSTACILLVLRHGNWPIIHISIWFVFLKLFLSTSFRSCLRDRSKPTDRLVPLVGQIIDQSR